VDSGRAASASAPGGGFLASCQREVIIACPRVVAVAPFTTPEFLTVPGSVRVVFALPVMNTVPADEAVRSTSVSRPVARVEVLPA
jgi:hypothetical protein